MPDPIPDPLVIRKLIRREHLKTQRRLLRCLFTPGPDIAMPGIVYLIGLVACLFVYSAQEAVAEGRVEVVNRVPHHGGMGPITVRLLPRSQWDPERRYRAARVVATRAIRICTSVDEQGGECSQERDAWSTVVSRDPHVSGPFEKDKQKYRMPPSHPFELYHTWDNITYEEIRVTPDAPQVLHPEDFALIEHTRRVAAKTQGKLIMRWGAGRLWYVPENHWNVGEHALHTGVGITTAWLELEGDQAEERPLYMPQ